MRVLAISAHPDDETLGCGGTLLRHAEAGDELYWIVTTQPEPPHWPADVATRKAAEVDAVAEAYGMRDLVRLGRRSLHLDTIPRAELIEQLGDAIAEIRPELVYTIHPGDVHTDHHVLFDAVVSVLKTFYMRDRGVRRLLSFETLSSSDAAPQRTGRSFVPQVYQDITPHLERKLEIMALFATEAQADPLPRGPSAIRALARHRGASIGVEYAEAFELVREIA